MHARTHARTHRHTHVRTCPHTRLHCHFVVIDLYYLYHCFKSTLQCDRYLGCMQSRIHKTALARFRLSVSRINCHRLRFSAASDQCNCSFRITSTEDECHKHYVVAMPSVHRLENKIIFWNNRTNWLTEGAVYTNPLFSQWQHSFKLNKIYIFCNQTQREQQHGQPQQRLTSKYRTMSKTKFSGSSFEYGSTAWSVSQ